VRRVRWAPLLLLALWAVGCGPIVIHFGRRPRSALGPGESAFVRLEREYLRAIERNPGDPAAPTALASAYHARGQYAESEKYFKRALKASPRFYAARSGLAVLYLDWGKPRLALAEAKLAAANNPGDAAAFALLGRTHLAGGQRSEAVAAFKKGLDLDPENVDLLLRLAHERLRAGSPKDALGLCRRAVGAAPDDPNARADLALALAAAGEVAEAVSHAAAAVGLDGAGASQWEVLGFVRNKSGDGPGAEEAYRRAVELDPDRVSARRCLAELLEARWRLTEALAEYQQVVSRAPQQRDALERIIHLATALKKPREVLAARLQLARAFPRDVELQAGAARAVESAGAGFRAVAIWERVLELEPGRPEAHRALGRLWRKLGKAGSAALHYTAVLQKDSEDPVALEGMAALCIERREFKKARGHCDKLVKAHPRRARGRALLGLVAAEMGDKNLAARELRAAIKLDAKLAIAHRELADVLRKMGEPAGARKHAELAVDLTPKDPRAWSVLARLEKSQGKKKAAARAYSQAVSASKRQDADLIWTAAAAAEEAGDAGAARGFYRHLTAAARQRAAAARQLARLAKAEGKSGEELYWLRAALLSAPREALWRGRVRRRLHELYGDEKAVGAALQLYWADHIRDREDPVALGGLGAMDLARRRYAGAARSYERLQAVKPRSREAASALVFIYEKLGRQGKSLGAALRLVAIDPKSSEARFTCARAYRRRGDRQREELALRAALKLDPKNAPAHNALGVLLAETDRLAEARGHFLSATKIVPKEAWPVHNLAVLTGKDLDDPEMAARYRSKVQDLVKAGAEAPAKGGGEKYWVFVPEEDW
jgi:tetratricopeptide (TPR) repeat protein